MYRYVILQAGFPVYSLETSNEDDIDIILDVADAMGIVDFHLQTFYQGKLIDVSRIFQTDES